MRVEFHPEAFEEFKLAAAYYGDCREGLDERFEESVREAVERIAEYPDRWRFFHDDVSRCLTKVFPYAILYTIEPDFIHILAVMHCRREPGYWMKRRT